MRLLRSILAGGAVVALASTSAAQAQTATPPEQAAADTYFDWMVMKAQQEDDRVSDPSALAAQIEPRCTSEEAQEQARFRATLDPSSIVRFDQL